MKRTQRIIVSIVLIILGLALLAATGIHFLDKITADKPTGLGTEILGATAALTSLASLVIGILTVRKKDQPAGKTELNVTGHSPQNHHGGKMPGPSRLVHNRKTGHRIPLTTPTLSAHPPPTPPPGHADFTGREKEIAATHRDLRKGVTISGLQGMGGIGKTALGLVIAHQLKHQFPDGQIFLDLRGAYRR